jgi:alpha-1,3-glucosyltransferase
MSRFIHASPLTPHFSNGADVLAHRLWMAATHQLPLEEWYSDERLLDECCSAPPPLFAWFHWLIGHAAALVDRELLDLSVNMPSAYSLVLFRFSGVLCNSLFVFSVIHFCRAWYDGAQGQGPSPNGVSLHHRAKVITVLVIFTPGLLLLDNVLFHYFGLVIGVFLLALASLFRGRHALCALLFAVALNLDQSVLFAAPVFALLLFRVCYNGLLFR